jgi:holo-[acyl-carrier protein] synthase
MCNRAWLDLKRRARRLTPCITRRASPPISRLLAPRNGSSKVGWPLLWGHPDHPPVSESVKAHCDFDPARRGEPIERDDERPDMTRLPIDVLTDQDGLWVGCDLHAVSNVAESIEAFGNLYLERVFTQAERRQCAGPNRVERLAGRFAAKEAVFKALRVPAEVAVPWNTIEVLSSPGRAPTVTLRRGTGTFARRQGIVKVEASISHAEGFAMAVAVAVVDKNASSRHG